MSEGYARRFGHEMTTPTKLYMDNELATFLAKRDGSFERSKCVMIRTNFIREGIEQRSGLADAQADHEDACRLLTKQKVTRLLKVDMLAAGMMEIPKPKWVELIFEFYYCFVAVTIAKGVC